MTIHARKTYGSHALPPLSTNTAATALSRCHADVVFLIHGEDGESELIFAEDPAHPKNAVIHHWRSVAARQPVEPEPADGPFATLIAQIVPQTHACTVVPIRANDGDLVGILGVGRTTPKSFTIHEHRLLLRLADDVARLCAEEMTEKTTHERRLALLEAVIAQIPDAVVVTESDARVPEAPIRIAYVNDAFTRQTGYAAAEVIGGAPDLLCGPGTDPDVVARIRDCLARDVPSVERLVYHRKDGQPYDVEVSIAPIRGEDAVHHCVSVQRDLTEHRQFEEARFRHEQERAMLLGQMPAIMFTMDERLILTSISGSGLTLVGLNEHDSIGRHVRELLSNEESVEWLETFDRALRGYSSGLMGRWHGRMYHTSISPLKNRDGAIIGVMGVAFDISETEEYRDQLAARESELARAQRIARLGSWIRDARGVMTLSHEAAHILDLPSEYQRIEEAEYLAMLPSSDVEVLQRCRAHALEQQRSYRIDYRITTYQGNVHWIEETVDVATCPDVDGSLSGTIQDVTERKRLEQRLHELAYQDPVTGIPNRRALLEEIEREIARAEDEKQPFAILIVDLDRFAMANDSLGHLVGDQILRAVAERMERAIGPRAMLGRLGGDEFLVILRAPTTMTDAINAGTRLLATLTSTVATEGVEVTVRSSIGLAMWPKHAHTTGELVEAADTAMYSAKHAGGNGLECYSPELRQSLERRRRLEDHLRRALSNHELSLVYQPIFDFAETTRVAGVEALLRWNSSAGPISPAEFVPIAEESGLIGTIGWWVLAESCSQGARWLSEYGMPIEMGVNVAAAQLRDERFVNDLVAILDRTSFPATMLTLELTERTAFDDDEAVQQTIRELDRLGVSLSIDDFGTGYSSLSSLKRLPVRTVKIDRLFISELPSDGFSRAICESVVALSHNLGYQVVAEGIETEAQATFLARLGVDRAQGFLLGKPMPPAALAELLRRQTGM